MALHFRQRELDMFGSLLHVAGVLGTIALMALMAGVVVATVDHSRAGYEAGAARFERLLVAAPRVRANHRRLVDELKTLRRRKEELRRRITDGAREGEFLRQVSETADRVSLRLREFRPGQISRNGQYGTMRIDLICEGSYVGICRFLEQLDQLPRLATVNRVEVTAPLHDEVYPFMVTLEIYFADDGPIASAGRSLESPDA